ncbi:hypothetical protein V372_00973 [Staphylococcus aureus M62794]|nr:hypothetical protein V372_00973 [Staphylococcus aureus M62794]
MNEEKLKMILLLLEDIPRDEWNRLVNEVNNHL